jgi:AraC-like DNA-binding protein
VIAEAATWHPPDLLRPYVSGYTGYRYLGFEPGEHMGLPSRHVTLVLPFDAPLELVVPNGDPTPQRFATVVSGFHTTPAVIRHNGNQHGIQLAVTPAGARALFAMPAGEVAADAVPLDALWGRMAAELLDRLDGAASWGERFAVLDRFLLRIAAGRAEVPSGVRDETAEAFRRLLETGGRVGVAALAEEVGWSRRHLSDQFVSEYGIGPKEMARVLRFEQSKAMFLQPGHAQLAAIAADCGYADQAHMAREWRTLAGASPTQWLAAEVLPVGDHAA